MRYILLFILLLIQFPAFSASVPYEMLGYTNIVRAGATGGSDDTLPIQRAINSAAIAGGGTVLFPEGTYTATTIFLSNNITLEFQGGAKLVFKTGATGYAIEQGTATNCNLRYVWLDGGLTTKPGVQGTRAGFHINGSDARGTLDNCTAIGFSDCGFRVFGTYDISESTENLTAKFDGCRVWACWEGYNFTSPNTSDTAEYTQLVNCQASECVYGVNIGAGNIYIHSSVITGNTRGIFVFGGANGAHGMANDNCLNHNTFPIWCEGFANGFYFQGNTIQGGGDTVVISNCTGVRIEGGIYDAAATVVGKSAGSTTAGLNYLGPVTYISDWNEPTYVGGAQLEVAPNNIRWDATNSSQIRNWFFTNMPSTSFPFSHAANGSFLTTSNGNLYIRTNFQWAPVAIGQAFDPTNVAGIAIRYDVNQLGLADGTTIHIPIVLLDSSGHDYHATDAFFSPPYYTNTTAYLNNLGWLYFSGSTALNTNIATSFAQPLTIYMVATVAANANGTMFSGPSANITAFRSSSALFLNAGSQISANIVDDQWYVIEFVCNGGSSTIKTNGVLAASGTIGANALQNLTIGAAAGGNQFGNFKMAYMMIYTNTAMSGNNSANIINWLNSRFTVY